MNFRQYLTEMFESEQGYNTIKSDHGKDIVFDIETGEIRDYKFVMKYLKDGVYKCGMGYKGNDDTSFESINGDFYDTNKLISSLIGIFTGIYLSTQNIDILVYTFEKSDNKSYRLLINSIFEKDLKNYYDIDNNMDNDYIVIRSNRSSLKLDNDQITDLLK